MTNRSGSAKDSASGGRKGEGVTNGRKTGETAPDPRLESAAAELERHLAADPAGRARVLQARMLAAGLGDANSSRRAEVRRQLLELGRPAIPALLAALTDSDARVRWQAAKALSQMHDPDTAVDLMNAMEDDDFGVRWLAAEGLIGMGPASLEAVLLGLLQCFDSFRLREGALHVLHALVDGGFHDEAFERLLHALQGPGPASEVGWAAERAWEKFTGKIIPEKGGIPAGKK